MELLKSHRKDPLTANVKLKKENKLSIITEAAEDVRSDSGSKINLTEEVQAEELERTEKLNLPEVLPNRSVSLVNFLFGNDAVTVEDERDSKTSLDENQNWSFRNLSIGGGGSRSSKGALEQNFFDSFMEIPNIDDISEDEDEWFKEKHQQISVSKSVSEPGIDPGRFVDSVTGLDINDDLEEETIEEPLKKIRSKRSMKSIRSIRSIKSIKSIESTSKHTIDDAMSDEEAADAITYTEEEEESEEEEPEDDDLLQEFDYEDELEEAGDAESVEDDMLNEFLQMESKGKAQLMSVVDFESLAEAEEARQVRLCITDFVDELIIEAIKRSEYLDVKAKLRNSLDKHALINNILRIFFYIKVENKARSFLNRKIIDYFRRKKLFNSITERNDNNFETDFAHYKEAIKHLDEMLGKEAATIKAVNVKIAQLKDELAQMETLSSNADESLKNLIKGTLAREGFNRLKANVENQVNNMMALHAEMSEVRFKLIQRQHTFAILDEKLKKLEQITETLQMRDYEHLQAETQGLSKKIEERNVELMRARKRVNCNLHMMAHMHAKETMLKNLHATRMDILNELYTQKQAMREYVNRLSLRRFRILQEIQKTNYKGGILSKRLLMYDFDKTVAHNNELRARIGKLNQRQAYLNEKITKITEQMQPESKLKRS